MKFSSSCENRCGHFRKCQMLSVCVCVWGGIWYVMSSHWGDDCERYNVIIHLASSFTSLSPALHTLKVAENVEMKFRIKCERDFVQLILPSDFSSFLWSESGRLIELWHIYGNFYTINFITLCALQSSPHFGVIFDEWIWDEWINNESHYQRPSFGDGKCYGTNSRNFCHHKTSCL